MSKIKLNKTDKTRLAELVDTYIKIDTEYKIEDNGSVTAKIRDKKLKWLLGMGETRDFHDITLNLIQRIMDQKASIINVQAFCSDAMSQMMTNNNRSSVIKSLYMAHLTEPQDEDEDEPAPRKRRRTEPQTVEVEIEHERRPSRNHSIRILQGMSSSEHIAQMLNNSECIVLHD